MKTSFLLFSLGLTTFGVLAFSLPPFLSDEYLIWPYPPSLSLEKGYRIATEAIGPATNDFHCIQTNGNLSWTSNGDWGFVFSSTNGHTKTVCLLRNFIYRSGETNDVLTMIFEDLGHE